MLTIRQEQVDAIAASRRAAVEPTVREHVRRFFESDVARAGEAALHELARLALVGSTRHGLEYVGEICSYAVLMAALGSGFDQDPQLPWAVSFFRDETVSGRFRRLFDRAVDYLGIVSGNAGEIYTAALLRARRAVFEDLDGLRRVLGEIHPEKMALLRDDDYEAFLQRGRQNAARDGFEHPRTLPLYLALMFLLGSDFARDPLFGALRPAIDSPEPDPVQRAKTLHAAALGELERALGIAAERRR